MGKLYKLLKNGEYFFSENPGKFAGNKRYKIFGTLECSGGKLMKKKNRVFFENLENAIMEGYRPCKKCKPIDEEIFEKIKYLLPHASLDNWYNSGKQFKK